MPVIQFESAVEGNVIRVPKEYLNTLRSGAKVTVSSYNNPQPHSVPAKFSRTGFLKEITIPEDFDRMCETEIEEIFGVKQ